MVDVKNWDNYFIQMAMLVAQKSKDPSTKVGCVLVATDNSILSTGFNGFPRGVDETDQERWGRPQKYSRVEHAERNAIYNAAANGIRLRGARAYLNWEPSPCADCARGLIQAGIVEVIGPNLSFTGKGAGVNYTLDYTKSMFDEAGVKYRIVPWEQPQ
jgi:dCMP deaminase